MIKKPFLTIVIPQHAEEEHVINHLLTSIACQVGINLQKVAIKIIGDGGYKLNQDFLNHFPLDVEYIYYQPAKGPGYARQVGLNHTYSKYITYMDADDQLNTVNALWKFMNVIRQSGDHEVIFSRYVEELPATPNGRNTYTIREFNNAAAYAKWLNVAFIRQHNFKWSSRLPYAYEDTFFMDQIIIFAKDIYYLDSITYSWLYNGSSIVRNNQDYNQWHLHEYIRENCLWSLEIKKRAPQRLRFDVNNGLVNIYHFIVNHPPVNKIKDQVKIELKLYLTTNYRNIDLKYAAEMYKNRFKDGSTTQFLDFYKEKLNQFKIRIAELNQDSEIISPKLLTIVIPFVDTNIKTILPLLLSINYQEAINFSDLTIIIVEDGHHLDLSALNKLLPNLEIKVIYSKSQIGPGLARQLGLDQVHSKFVTFLDADDQLYTVNSLFLMQQRANLKPDSEIIIGRYFNEQVDDNGYHYLCEWDYNFGAVYPIWFNVAFLRSYQIKFDPHLHSYYEDTYFVGLASRLAKNTEFLNQVVYNRILNKHSLVHALTDRKRKINYLIEFCRENYYWFEMIRYRLPDELSEDLSNFLIGLYYMYQNYKIDVISVNNRIKHFTKLIYQNNQIAWQGWTEELQKKADGMNSGDAKGQSSKHLKQFIKRFFE